MKKVVIAFDGTHFSEGAFKFALQINEIEPILLTGVFLSPDEEVDNWAYGVTRGAALPIIREEELKIAAPSIDRFEKLCQANGIEYRVHENFPGSIIHGFQKESMFADLVIIGSQSFYENVGVDTLNENIEDALRGIKSSAVIVPENFDFPTSQILAYDGSADSVFAIKQFAYLFPNLAKNETLLVYAHEDEDKEVPDRILIEELAARHFDDLEVCKLTVDPGKYFSTWLAGRKHTILVCGSFGHPWYFKLFHKSFVQEVIASHNMPVFIAHP